MYRVYFCCQVKKRLSENGVSQCRADFIFKDIKMTVRSRICAKKRMKKFYQRSEVSFRLATISVDCRRNAF